MDLAALVLGHFLGSFIAALALAGIWLLICRYVPALQRRPGVRRVAVAITFVPLLISADSPRYIDLIACFLAAAGIYWYALRTSGDGRRNESNASV
jgi:hypothetical protein